MNTVGLSRRSVLGGILAAGLGALALTSTATASDQQPGPRGYATVAPDRGSQAPAGD